MLIIAEKLLGNKTGREGFLEVAFLVAKSSIKSSS